ncbi:hypothetical protein ACFQL4_18990 [Halosimplex aquaticum]
MTGSDDDTDDGGEDSDGSAVVILHLDPDETVRSRLAAVIDESDDDVTYEGTGDVERARERLDEETSTCWSSNRTPRPT